MQNKWAPTAAQILGLCAVLFVGLLVAVSLVKPDPKPKPQAAEPFKKIVVAGDISCEADDPKTPHSCHAGDTARLVQSLHPDAVLTTGDNQYSIGTLADFENAYDKTWGAFKDITYPTPGNHEYGTPGASGYYDYFGERAGDRDKGYYSFTLGDWRLFALNSEIDVSETSQQIAWLDQELSKTTNECTLAYWHKPRFSAGEHEGDPNFDTLWRVLYAHDVDIVANGHSHAYERFVAQNPDGQPDQKRGITQFVSGMGGRSAGGLRPTIPTLATRQNHAFGVLELKLYKDSARFAFVPVPGAQTFSDSGMVACH